MCVCVGLSISIDDDDRYRACIGDTGVRSPLVPVNGEETRGTRKGRKNKDRDARIEGQGEAEDGDTMHTGEEDEETRWRLESERKIWKRIQHLI